MSDKSGVSSQVITLPSGGGALSGIGEKFAPDLYTGTGNFSVPIAVPPGRNGFQPDLNLVYSTGNGNSCFGLGWDLSIPSISRKTSQGIPRYENRFANPEDHDTFILSGAEDLVPIKFGTDMAEYRPRTEGLFAKVERRTEDGLDYWRVRSKDGLVSYYGNVPVELADPTATESATVPGLAAVADPNSRRRIFCWKLARTEDPFGNHILYDYIRDSDDDLLRDMTLPLPDPDQSLGHRWDQLLLQRIRYIDYDDNGTTAYLTSVEFEYEERHDAFSSYRAGFEIRTRLRCTKIIVRTHAGQDRIVRQYHLDYLDQRVELPNLPEQLPVNGVSLLNRVHVEGVDESQPADSRTEQLPPLEFDYTRFEPGQPTFKSFTAPRGLLPDRSLNDPSYEIISLFGNGLPDVIQMNGAARYWRNLGNGEFDIPRPMNPVPAGVQLADAGVQLADLDGDGRTEMMVTNGIGANGYFSLDLAGEWQGFTPYAQSPTIDLEASDVRMFDLDGDGIADALRISTNFELFYHDRNDGWNDAQVIAPIPPEEFPNVNFNDPRVKLGDMSGDNLQDIVLVQNGGIDYWPYMGYGKWGNRITMTNNPEFPDAGRYQYGYDPARLLIGDVDGDGLDDIVYVQPTQVTVWINQSGNRWSEPITIDGTPPITDQDEVRLADMLGVGAAGVLWTYNPNTQTNNTYRFLDLTSAINPYMLNKMDNNMGAVTHVQYTSSTEFYLADAIDPNTRWQTPLPFPVQVISQVRVEDYFSKNVITTEYRYRHGYWDGVEREFRGFGMVEQIDTERSAQLTAGAEERFTPPVLTRTWFHQGSISLDEVGWEEADYSTEYWFGDPQVLNRPVDVTAATSRAKRDAIRSLRGRVIRTELYALEDVRREESFSDEESQRPVARPYTVTESQFNVVELFTDEVADVYGDRADELANTPDEPRRIFFPTTVATRTTQWERGDEPMTSFGFTVDFDVYGQPLRQIALAVPRNRDFNVADASAEPYLGTVTTTTYAQREDADRYIVDRVSSTQSEEILNNGSQSLLDLVADVENGTATLDLFEQSFTYYDGAAFEGLPLGQLDDFGAAVRSETLVLTENILHEAYKSSATPTNPPEVPPYLEPTAATSWTDEYPAEFQNSFTDDGALVGYTFADGTDHRAPGYFVQATRSEYDFQLSATPTSSRGLMQRMRDPLGNDTAISEYDSFDLMPLKVTDAVGLTSEASYDYRVMQPHTLTDPNNNVTEFTFTPLGLLRETFARGELSIEGDENKPSSQMAYNWLAFVNSVDPDDRQPVSVTTIQREHHDTELDVSESQRDDTIVMVEFSDGFGRLLQTRAQAEDLLFGDDTFGNGVCPAAQDDVTGTTAPVVGRLRDSADELNVSVSGWQLYDNKGQEVVKYEPFYSVGFAYQTSQDATEGQRVTMIYDPRGQVIRTTDPDGSVERVIYGRPKNPDELKLTEADLKSTDVPASFVPTPWEAYTYDPNDLAPTSRGLLPNGSEGLLIDRAPAHHHFTPSHIVIDALGRTTLAVARNRDAPQPPSAQLPAIDEFHTKSTYDIRGNLLTVIDAEDREAFVYAYDLANQPLRTENIDAGVRRVILNAIGNEIERRDSKGALILQGYDALHRPHRLWARDDGESPTAPTLRQRLIYGDSAESGLNVDDAKAANLKGTLYKHYDEAGLCIFESYDFKGNLLEKVRRVIADDQILSVFPDAADPAPDWNIQPYRVNWQPPVGTDLASHESTLLEGIDYRTSMTYDAVNRAKTMQYPQDVDGQRKVLRPSYNRAGALESVVLSADISQPNGDTYVQHIVYNARGQRTLIGLGNGIMTRYAYDEQTFRLARMRSERFTQPDDNGTTYQPAGNVLQDCRYEYDLVGNILRMTERTAGSGVRNNPDAMRADNLPDLGPLLSAGNALVRRFDYDAIYRLKAAEGGREANNLSRPQPWNENPLWHGYNSSNHGTPNQENAPNLTQIYDEFYNYDRVDNLIVLEHRSRTTGNGATTVRNFDIKLNTNQLDIVSIGNSANAPQFNYVYNANGNIVRENTERHLEWDHSDQMKAFRNQTAEAEPTIHAHYLYDSAGIRVKKVARQQGGSVEATTYINEMFEYHRWGDNSDEQNNYLHIMDDQKRVALVRVESSHPSDGGPSIQYHLGDHLGSSNIVMGGEQAISANFLNREEHTPYGESSFGSFGRKRYRFTGQERDEESGLNYHAARYYLPWLGRWSIVDPEGAIDGLNLYTYTRNNPINYIDPDGLNSSSLSKQECTVENPTGISSSTESITRQSIPQISELIGEGMGGQARMGPVPPEARYNRGLTQFEQGKSRDELQHLAELAEWNRYRSELREYDQKFREWQAEQPLDPSSVGERSSTDQFQAVLGRTFSSRSRLTVVYLRINLRTGKPYVGRTTGDEFGRFLKRQFEHSKKNRQQYEWRILEYAETSLARIVEQEWMIRFGGPSRWGGPLENKRWEIAINKYPEQAKRAGRPLLEVRRPTSPPTKPSRTRLLQRIRTLPARIRNARNRRHRGR